MPGGPATDFRFVMLAGAVAIPAVQAAQNPKPASHEVEAAFVTELKVSVVPVFEPLLQAVGQKKDGVPRIVEAQLADVPVAWPLKTMMAMAPALVKVPLASSVPVVT